MKRNNQTPRAYGLTVNPLKNIIQQCHQQRKKSLRQRQTKISPAPHKDFPYCFIVRYARGHTASLDDLEQADISFMPIGHAPEHDHAPRDYGGDRFLRRQGTRSWTPRRWYASWGIQVYTGVPSERHGAQWHDLTFKYDAICAAPDAILACIETLVNSVANPLLTLSKSGGLRFSCRVQDYLHPNTEKAREYIHKHVPTTENPYHRDVYLEILGAEGYNRWDGRYGILLGDLLDPPTISKDVLFSIVDELRATLHEPAPASENNVEPTFQAASILSVEPPGSVDEVDEKVVAVREGKLSPLAIKRPSPMLYKSEDGNWQRPVLGLHVIEHDPKTGWFCAVDEAGAHLCFTEISIPKAVLDTWNTSPQGTPLSNFAIALLHALENTSDLYENPVNRIRTVMHVFDKQEETLIQQMGEKEIFWHQLKHFFAHYQWNDAPITWDQNELRFWIPSAPDMEKIYPNVVKNTESEPWLAGNRVFQIRTGIYSAHQLLNYDNSWDDLGYSEIGRRFFHGIQAEIEKDPAVRHVVVCGEGIAKELENNTSTENARYLSHIKRRINVEGFGSALELADVIWIVGAPYWPPHLMWKQAQILFGNDVEPLYYDVNMNPYQYRDNRIQELCEQNIRGILMQLVNRMGLNRLSNKTVVLLTAIPLPNITDRPETVLFDWEDFEVAGGLDKLPETIAERQRFETERDNLTAESGRKKVEQVLGISSSQANRVLMKLRGGKIQRVPFQEQIFSLLENGEKKTSELIDSIEGHPGAVKNELKRLVETGEVVKVRRAMYALPKA